jgi:Flp pilus assembly CpaE family ATPase
MREAVLLLNQCLHLGGEAETIRRVMNRVLEQYRLDQQVPFERFYDVPKDDHHEAKLRA